MVDFRALETFIWVVSLKSFRGAAEKLNTTQPAVSQRIAALERDVGHTLINRKSRNVAPTAAGRRLLDHAERLIAARAEMMAELSTGAALRGSLSLGVNETIAHTWLPAFVERLGAKFPGLDVDIDVDISENLRGRAIAHDIDLALMLGPVAGPHLQARHLCRFPLAFIVAKSLRIDRSSPDLATIAQHPILTFARNTLPHAAVRDILARPGLPRARIRASSSLATIVRMALDGNGVAVIPPAIVAQELRDGRLACLRSPVDLPDLVCDAAWRKGPNAFLVQSAAGLAAEVAADYAGRNIGAAAAKRRR